MTPRLWLFACAGLALGGIGCSGNVDVQGPSVANPLDAEESAAVAAINTIRTGAGLSSLKVCTILNVSAAAHADDMRDHGYLSDTSPDGTTSRKRACAAGYTTACSPTSSIAELVASGNASGTAVVQQWDGDPSTTKILRDPVFLVVGVGVSIGGSTPHWSMDLGSADEAACN
jgi:uncharacterized protein YkwD